MESKNSRLRWNPKIDIPAVVLTPSCYLLSDASQANFCTATPNGVYGDILLLQKIGGYFQIKMQRKQLD